MHFKVEKLDSDTGYIKTLPLPAAQFFEFWRKDNADKKTALEANIHSIRRIVELQIEQKNNQLCLSCNVTVQRLSVPDLDVESNRGGLQRPRLGPEGNAWLDLEQDKKLATTILRQIEKRIKQ